MQTHGSVDTQKCTKQQALNLPTLLLPHTLGSSSDNSSFGQQSLCPDLSGMSLSQLMSGHVQKTKEEGDAGRSFRLPLLSTPTSGSISPSSITCNQNSLSLGTLASLNMPSGAQSSAPSLLAIPLSNLSLSNSVTTITTTSSALPRSGLSLGSFLSNSGVSQSSSGVGGQAKMAHPKGSLSLSDLIQEHSNCSSSAKIATAPTQMLSLSELAAQHQGGKAHVQLGITGRPENNFSSTITPASFGGGVVLTELALPHLANATLTESGASAFIEPYSSLAAPCTPAGSSREGVTNHKPSHRSPRSSKPRQTVDVGTLMEQPDEQPDDSSSLYFSGALSSLYRMPSAFAKPSVFAWALSFQSHKFWKRRNILVGQIHKQATGSDHQDLGGERQELSTTLSPITPFLFDTPSPDDIIRANQLKAFTR